MIITDKPYNVTEENFAEVWDTANGLSGIPRYLRKDITPDPFKAVEIYEALLAYAEETDDRDKILCVSRDLARGFSYLNGPYFAKNGVSVLNRMFEKIPETAFADIKDDLKWTYAVSFYLLVMNTVNDIENNYETLGAVLTRAEHFWKAHGYWDEFNGHVENDVYAVLGLRYEYGWKDPMPESMVNKLYGFMRDKMGMDKKDFEGVRGGEATQYIAWLQLSYTTGNLRKEDYTGALEKMARAIMAENTRSDAGDAGMHRLQLTVLCCGILGKYGQCSRELAKDVFVWLNTLPPTHLGHIYNLKEGIVLLAEIAGHTRKYYIHTLLKATTHVHVPTYAHCLMVGELMAVTVDYLYEKDPAPFRGMFGKKPKTRIIEEARLAGEGHDVGKISYINVISQMGRKLTDYEFQLIKAHPQMGSSFYASEDLKCIRDVALGHHKTYCGKGGYPFEYDTNESGFKMIIDIASVADSVDAATDYIGRGYHKTKTVDAVVDEIIEQSNPDNNGVIRYSPAIAAELGADGVLRGLIKDVVENFRYTAYARAYAAFAPPKGKKRG